MKRLLYYLLLLLLVSFSACDKDESESCVECDEALHHMGDKMHTYACNPNYMENAWDAINLECDRGNQKVGYMAETCALGETRVPACGEVLSTADFQDKVLFKTTYISSTVTDSINVTLTNIDGPVYEDDVTFVLGVNQTVSIPHIERFQEGDMMHVIFGVEGNFDVEQKKFSFNRPDKWGAIRSINITQDQQTDTFNLEFVDW